MRRTAGKQGIGARTAARMGGDGPGWFRDRKGLVIAAGVFAVGLAVRAAYLYDSSDNPTFRVPMIDAGTYDQRARDFVEGKGMGEGFFWQPFLYPFFLSVVYFFTHSSIVWAKGIQIVLGSVTCVLTWRLGERVFGRRAGVAAGVMTAVYGPLIFYEAELLSDGMAALWSVVLLLVMLKAAESGGRGVYFGLGVCGALSVLTRPTFVPFLAVGSVWLLLRVFRGEGGRRCVVYGVLTAVGFALPALPVAVQNLRVTGHFGILPSSGGMNLYVGNNAEYCRTMTIRPGRAWLRLGDLPARYGAYDLWAKQEFFYRKTREFVFGQPWAYVEGLARKAVRFVNSREMPRNEDLYLFRRWSGILAALTWKADGFGFPFGVLLPLTLAGLLFCRREVPVPVWLFLILYPLSIILVFVSARYRLAVIPPMCVVAAGGLAGLPGMIRGRLWGRLGVGWAATVGAILLGTLPGPFCEEETNYEAEMYVSLGLAALDKGRADEAVGWCGRALQSDPGCQDAYYAMGVALDARGDTSGAIVYYTEAVRLNPEDAEAHNNLAVELARQGKTEEAIDHFVTALRIEPNDADVHNNMGAALNQMGKVNEAIEHFRRAVHFKPDFAKAYKNLAAALDGQGEAKEAITHYRHVVRIDPSDVDAHNNLGILLAKQGKLDQAIEHFARALQLEPGSEMIRRNLAAAEAQRRAKGGR